MGKAEADQARRELAHALEALGDGKALKLGGTHGVYDVLQQRDVRAARAYEASSLISWDLAGAKGKWDPSREQRLRYVANMRKLAPVILELLLEE